MPRVLTKSAPTFINIYADMPVEQKDVSTQAYMFLAVSSPKQPELAETTCSTSFEETMYVRMYMCDVILYNTTII